MEGQKRFSLQLPRHASSQVLELPRSDQIVPKSTHEDKHEHEPEPELVEKLKHKNSTFRAV
jgi:hypothetical protein